MTVDCHAPESLLASWPSGPGGGYHAFRRDPYRPGVAETKGTNIYGDAGYAAR